MCVRWNDLLSVGIVTSDEYTGVINCVHYGL